MNQDRSPDQKQPSISTGLRKPSIPLHMPFAANLPLMSLYTAVKYAATLDAGA